MTADEGVQFQARAQDGACIRVIVRGEAPTSLSPFLPQRGLVETGIDGHVEPETTLDVELASEIGQAYLESSLGLFAASHLQGEVAIHAALIRAGSQVLLLPAPSLSGKTSMCVAARRAGHEVLGDEYVLVDPQSGLLRTWPRAMRIRDGRSSRREDIDIELGTVQPTLVAALTYDEQSDAQTDQPLTVRVLTPGELAVELLSNTLCAQYRPEDSLAAVMAIARQTPGVMGTRAEAVPALRALLDLEL